MPLTGFLDGFNEQRLVEQRLQDEAQLAQLRAVEVGMGLQKMQNTAMVQSTLSRVFSEGAPGAGPESEEQIAAKMEKSGAAIMAVDPTHGLHLLTGAAAIRQKKALEAKEIQDTRTKQTEAQGSALSAITGPENYAEGVQEAVNRGWKIPGWYTGDWEKDKDKVEFAANSTMKSADQSRVKQREIDTGIRLNDLAHKATVQQAAAEMKQSQLELQQERNARLREAEDRRAADAQTRRSRAEIATKEDKQTARDAIDARQDLELDVRAKNEIASRAASRARKKLGDSVSDEDFNTILNGEIDDILAKETTQKATVVPDWIPFLGGKELGKRKVSLEAPAKAAAPAKPDVRPQLPQIGEVRKGYRFKGGDPSKPENWTKVQ